MIPNISWGEMMILLVAALVILGPERLPGAIRWTFATLRRVRDYASGTTQQLRSELGPEFDELRKPIEELQRLRGMTPRAVITKHLLDGDDSVLRDVESSLPGRDWLTDDRPSPDRHDVGSSGGSGTTGTAAHLYSDDKAGGGTPAPQPLRSGERPPIDFDAT